MCRERVKRLLSALRGYDWSGMDGPFDIYLNNTVVKTNIMNVRSTTVNTMKLEEKGLI